MTSVKGALINQSSQIPAWGYGGTYPPLSMGMEPLGPWGIKLAIRLGPWGTKLAIRLGPWGIKVAIRLGYGPFPQPSLDNSKNFMKWVKS